MKTCAFKIASSLSLNASNLMITMAISRRPGQQPVPGGGAGRGRRVGLGGAQGVQQGGRGADDLAHGAAEHHVEHA